jgi:uncharacterized protein involved in cysteine biosynthesis
VQREINMLRENEIITADAVANEYRLSEPLAREIVAEETQRALRRSWAAWLVFLAGIGLAGFLYFVPGSDKSSALWVLLGSMGVWMLLGRYLAGPAIRKAAKDKASRLAQLHS